MPHKMAPCLKDGIAKRDGALYAAWRQGRLPRNRFTTEGITRDVLLITNKTTFPLDITPILTAMSRLDSGLTLHAKVYLFGRMFGLHEQRRMDRETEKNTRQQITQRPSHDHGAIETERPLAPCVSSLRALADRLDDQYHVAEAYERRVYQEGHIGTDGSWHGDGISLAIARERVTLLRSVLGELEPILHRMEDTGIEIKQHLTRADGE